MRDRRATRQLAATVALVLAAGALVATSPPQPPINEISGRASTRAILTSDASVASVRVTYSASDEALWSDDPEVNAYQASVYFSASGGWRSLIDAPASPADRPDRPIVRLTVIDTASGRPLSGQGSRLGDAGVQLLEVCPENLDCVLVYDLIVEWVDPIPGLEVSVEAEASSLIQIQGPVDVPLGARAALEMGEAVARAVPVLSDGVNGAAVLDNEHPLALWSVVLTASEGAIPAALTWPIESRASFTATFAPVSDDPDAQLDDGNVRILLIPELGEEVDAETTRGSGQHDFDPFAGCSALEPCERALMIAIRWLGTQSGLGAEVNWRLDSGIVYHGDAQPAGEAAVEARVESETVIGGRESAASIDGVIELDAGRPGSSKSQAVALHIPRTALLTELLGGPVPAVTGTLTVEATTPSALNGDPLFVSTSLHEATEIGSSPLAAAAAEVNRGQIETPIHPATDCRAGRACDASLNLYANLPGRDVERLGDALISVTWRIEIRLLFPVGSDPPSGAPIRLSHVEP